MAALPLFKRRRELAHPPVQARGAPLSKWRRCRCSNDGGGLLTDWYSLAIHFLIFQT
jgi:hypothetical protein